MQGREVVEPKLPVFARNVRRVKFGHVGERFVPAIPAQDLLSDELEPVAGVQAY